MTTFINIAMAVILAGFSALVLYVLCKCFVAAWRDFTGDKE